MLGVARAGRRGARAKATPPSQAAVATAPRQSKQPRALRCCAAPVGERDRPSPTSWLRPDGSRTRPGALLRRTEALLLATGTCWLGHFSFPAPRPRRLKIR